MTKKATSVKLDDRHVEILETRSRQFGIKKSEYIRSLIDADHRSQINSTDDDLALKTTNVRNLYFNEITLAIIKALTREFDTTKNKKKQVSTIRGFAKKYDFKPNVVKSVLSQLVKNGIFVTPRSKNGSTNYLWTYLGVTAFPEYAPIDTKDEGLVSGCSCDALSGMLGEYVDVVDHLSTILNIDKSNADSLLRFFLRNYVGYFNWLREVIFPLTGVNDSLDNSYYRNQMIDYLLMLIPNHGFEWKDWKTDKMLNLKEIFHKILDHKKLESDLA